MNIIMLGAPGAGKGTISSRLKEIYNLPHIATGDIFRENIKNETELGKKAKDFIDKGKLVPDDITINMMIDRISKDDCKNGYILDGFPRTLAQADGLDKQLKNINSKIDLALLVEADEETLIKRLSGRRVCEKCGATYHIEHLKPKTDGVCDVCGGKLIIRKDDTEEVIKDRLKTYHEQTEPLIEYYTKQNLVKTVNGFDDINVSLQKISEMMK